MRLPAAALLLLALACVHAQYILPASYISPYDAGWDKIIGAGASKVPIALINPNSGPGPSATDGYVLAYKTLTKRAQAVGIKMFGYVDSNYGTVPIATALSQINKYFDWMGVNGIFIDQASTNCGITSYYNQIYQLVKGKGGEVILNPGTPTNECYMAVGDIMLSAETSWTAYSNANYPNPAWVTKYAKTRFWHIAYSVPVASFTYATQLANNRHAAYVYFTELGLPNPYAPLTTYWSALMNAVTTVYGNALVTNPTGGATAAPKTAAPAPAPATALPVNIGTTSGSAVGLAALNPLPSTAGPVWQMMAAGFSADGLTLRLSMASYTAFNLSGTPKAFWPRINFYLDLDNNAATGWSVGGGVIGSELLVQGDKIYRQAAGTFNAGPVGTATASATQNLHTCTLSIAVADLRTVYASYSTIRVVGHNDETGQYIPPTGSYLATSK
jgi:hypothetical protein